MASLTNGQESEQTPGDGEGQRSLSAAVHGVTKSRARLGKRTTTTSSRIIDKMKGWLVLASVWLAFTFPQVKTGG